MNRPDEQDYIEKLEARVKELESFIEGLKRNLKEENLTYITEIDINKEGFKDLTKQILIPKYTLLYKSKPLKEWEKENNHLTDVNKKVERKLHIAEEALNNIHFFDCDTCKNLKFKCDDKCDDKVDKIVEQALQKMKEVK